jgi:ElaB/YqjD/DUF883 family membrane-anchored ribosome-binding protein
MAQTERKIENNEPKNQGQINLAQQSKSTENPLSKESLKETAGDALNQIKEKTSGVLTEQKETLTTGLSSVADSLRQVSDNLKKTDEPNKIGDIAAQYGGDFARQIDRFAGYVENADFQDLARDVKSYARRQPALFIGGAFTLGLLLARFLKTSHPTEFIRETVRNTSEKKPDGEFRHQGVQIVE